MTLNLMNQFKAAETLKSPAQQQTGFHTRIKMPESLQQLLTSLQLNQALCASALVGRKVLVEHNQFFLKEEGKRLIVIDVPRVLDELHISILSEAQGLVKTFALGSVQTGFYEVLWEGTNQQAQPLNPGLYQVIITAWEEDQEIRIPSLFYANIDSLNLGVNGTNLQLKLSDIGLVSLDQVRQII